MLWCRPGSSVGIATELRAGRSGDRIPVGGARFYARPDRPWGPPSLLYNGYWVFPGGKVWPGCAADHSPPSSAVVLEVYSYTSTPIWATTGPVTGLLYLYPWNKRLGGLQIRSGHFGIKKNTLSLSGIEKGFLVCPRVSPVIILITL